MDRQNQEIQTFDQESVRMGLNALVLNDNYDLVAGDTNDSVSGSMLSLAHSNSASSFTHTAL
jgi:thousand and one amino acid protein kinase